MRKAVRDRLGPFCLGGAVAAGVNLYAGWWLNSRRGVALGTIAFFAAAAALSIARGGAAVPSAVALWSGAVFVLAIALFSSGAGTLWPIVLVFTAAIAAAAVGLGTTAGQITAARRRNRPQ